MLSDKIRDLRKKKGMTLEDLAEAINSGKSYIWQLESEGVKKPSAARLNAIARVLGVTVEYLLDDEAKTDSDKTTSVDKAFYRKYQQLPDKTRDTIRKIIGILYLEYLS